jgi:hypothetical protein
MILHDTEAISQIFKKSFHHVASETILGAICVRWDVASIAVALSLISKTWMYFILNRNQLNYKNTDIYQL